VWLPQNSEDGAGRAASSRDGKSCIAWPKWDFESSASGSSATAATSRSGSIDLMQLVRLSYDVFLDLGSQNGYNQGVLWQGEPGEAKKGEIAKRTQAAVC
jgi:hypothetical protein